jgi:hypothetical protein
MKLTAAPIDAFFSGRVTVTVQPRPGRKCPYASPDRPYRFPAVDSRPWLVGSPQVEKSVEKWPLEWGKTGEE